MAAAAAALSSEAMSLESIMEAKWMQSRKIKVWGVTAPTAEMHGVM